jgi:peptidyl-prolyl cis-trans isomerase SurA
MTIFSRRAFLPLMTCVLASPICAQTLDGASVTEDDIEQRTKLNFVSTHKRATRQDVIDELGDDRVKIKEAQKLGVNPTSADVDAAYAGLCSRMRITPEQLAKSLEAQGIRPETLKQRIRADMARNSLVRLRRMKF